MKYQLNFHQKFPPEIDALAQIVRVASPSLEFLSKEEISHITTISTGSSSGKVLPNLYYAEAMGLINIEKNSSKYRFNLTPLGEIVKNEDPFIMEEITRLACHCNLVNKNSPVSLWAFVFNYFIPRSSNEFNHSQLLIAAQREFNDVKINIDPFKICYNVDRSLKSISPIKITENQYEVKSLPIKKEYKYLYAYLLLKNWELYLGDESEITIDQIKEELGYGNEFVWSEKELLIVLELLEEEALIGINGQLTPITIIKKTSSTQILSKIYSLLL